MADGEDDSQKNEKSKLRSTIERVILIALHILFIIYFIAATVIYTTYDKQSKKCIPLDDAVTNGTNGTGTAENSTTGTAENSTETKEPFVPFILCEINWCHGYGFLIISFIIFHIVWIYYVLFKPFIGLRLYNDYIDGWIDKWIEFSRQMLVSTIMLILVIVLSLAYLLFECRDDWMKAVGILGPVTFIFLAFILSKHHTKVPWRIVSHGILAQLLLAIFCLRWPFGRSIFQCIGEKVARFLSFARYGALFVYGERIVNEFVFAFAILAVVFFFSVVSSILYYLGWMQLFLGAMGYALQAIVGTTTCESVNAVGNVFLGMSESPLIIRPYIHILTLSELHTICTSGYATVAGTVFGAYISFGANPTYLIAASVMGAPGSLAFAKLFLPETEESETRAENIKLEKSQDSSILDAAASGAASAVIIVLGIVSNIIAFLAILYFLDAVIEWLLELLGFENITLLKILTNLFWPVAFIMGVPSYDCPAIGLIIAQKSLINEFFAYKTLGEYIKDNKIDPRSAAIATFALCGFANPGSLGILIAALSAMAPTRRGDITRVAIRAFFAGSFVSFTSASLAGLSEYNNCYICHV
ncbi:hypothetical protein KR018_010592 [Drosophila ironensis]|nr:hypothetical protein KR018_010592 [Drosophila ironensis]